MKRFVTFDTGDKMYHLEIAKSHPYVLSAGSPGRVKKIAGYLNQAKVIESDRGLVTVHGDYKGLPVTAFSTGMGPASVSIVLPEIIEACDDPDMTIIRLGTSGALQPHLNIGDFVVTTEVDRRENTSDKIMGEGYRAFACPNVQQALEEAADNIRHSFQKVYVGPTRVVNDIYFSPLTDKSEDPGEVLAVSMEFSVYCALRDRYNRDFGQNIKTGNLLVISDTLPTEEDEQIDMTEFQVRKDQIEAAHIKAGLETLLKLSQV